MINFLKYLRGYVRIRVWGFSPERFMNLCSSRNILLWDIVKKEDAYEMCISLKSFRRLKGIARKTKTRVVILKRCGLPFLLPQLFARKVFLLGFAAAFFFWYWSSLYIWDISIQGNTAITEDMFLDFLEKQEICVGMPKKALDIEQLEKEIRREYEQITWTSAKLSGTGLTIAVKENDAVLSAIREEGYSDLYAQKEGVIVSMIVRSGVPQVAIGDTVERGTLLVSGSVPVYNEDATVRKYQHTRADADVVVERVQEVYEVLPFVYEKKEYTGREKRKFFISMGQRELTVGGEVRYPYADSICTRKEISLLKGVTLPVSFGTYVYREYLPTEREYSLREAEELLKQQYAVFLERLQKKGTELVEENVRMDSDSGVWVMKGELLVRERIGEEIFRETEPVSGEIFE